MKILGETLSVILGQKEFDYNLPTNIKLDLTLYFSNKEVIKLEFPVDYGTKFENLFSFTEKSYSGKYLISYHASLQVTKPNKDGMSTSLNFKLYQCYNKEFIIKHMKYNILTSFVNSLPRMLARNPHLKQISYETLHQSHLFLDPKELKKQIIDLFLLDELSTIISPQNEDINTELIAWIELLDVIIRFEAKEEEELQQM